jgi:hypothetical protein
MSVLDLIKASRPAVIPVELSVGTVYIKEMDGHQFELVQRSTRKDLETGETNSMSDAQLSAMVLCEQEGTPCFPTPEAGVPYMLTMKASDLRKLATAAMKSAGTADTAEERAAKEKKA